MVRSRVVLFAALVPWIGIGAAGAEDVPPAAQAPSAQQAAVVPPAAPPEIASKPTETEKPAVAAAPPAATEAPPAVEDKKPDSAQAEVAAPAVTPAQPRTEAAKSEPVQAATAAPAVATPAPAAEPAAQAAAPVQAAEAAPPFALASELAERISREKSATSAREDRDAAVKFYDARKGAPLWVTDAGLTPAAQALSAEISKADDFGLDAKAFTLPATIDPGASRAALADAEATLTLAALKYARYARGGRMDPSALSGAIDRKAQLLPAAKVLEQLAAADKPEATLRGFQPQNPQFEKLRQKLLALKAGQNVVDAPAAAVEDPSAKPKKGVVSKVEKPMSPAALERKLLANMEMWRWMPALGNYYIQPNIPEYTVRVMKDGHAIHTERIVTGQTDKMTPMFSDEMRLVVFKPFWNVPESIKYKEMMPQLMRGASLAKSGYRADINGRPIAGDVDWKEIDMRQVHIYQPPGEANALGRVKFLFPNKHDVYLHDTPSKSLFNANIRALSHGCMRVRDPLKLAEVILGADKGWTRAQVDQQATSGPENTEIKLTKPVPIHITYFTAWVDDAGTLQTVNDIYGHENRIQLGLEGKVSQIAQQKPSPGYAPPSSDERRRYAEQKSKSSDPVGDFFKKLFN